MPSVTGVTPTQLDGLVTALRILRDATNPSATAQQSLLAYPGCEDLGGTMTSKPAEESDPRARWRHLPAEPDRLIEETATDTKATDHGFPVVDVTEDFVRKYGL
ncbi:hypothetical protein [Nocardia coubleae]|uniref:Uncharacterized protein n=1 Tax=Nocardia coubleae TaxID=356147 RepID=A0A846WCU7_9NOCA|nr:hypothetical protein [Nocardia coubleae]NKX91339.1 hypothetical protein [Nocardia coubleae]